MSRTKGLIYGLALLVCQSAWAGFLVGNGGIGVQIKRDISLLDFYEVSVFEDPEMVEISVPMWIEKRLHKKLGHHLPETLPMILTKIYGQDRVLALACIKAIEFYKWDWVSTPLKPTQDFSSAIDIDPNLLVQLANRDQLSILLNDKLWYMLSDASQAGLILHEVISSWTLSKLVKPNDAQVQSAQRQVRQIVRSLFNSCMNDYCKIPQATLETLPHGDFKIEEILENETSIAWSPKIHFGIFYPSSPMGLPSNRWEEGFPWNNPERWPEWRKKIQSAVCKKNLAVDVNYDVMALKFYLVDLGNLGQSHLNSYIRRENHTVPFKTHDLCTATDHADFQKLLSQRF